MYHSRKSCVLMVMWKLKRIHENWEEVSAFLARVSFDETDRPKRAILPLIAPKLVVYMC